MSTTGRTPITLHTPRLTLREPTLDDTPALHRALGNPKTMRYIGDGKPRPIERIRAAVEWSIALFSERRIGGFMVVRNDTGELIGDALLVPIAHTDRTPTDPDTGVPDFADLNSRGPHIELGYRLHPDAWGNGFATEAARAVFDYATMPEARGGVGLTHLVGVTHPDNLASQRVLEKVGFTRRGLSEFYYSQPTMLFEWGDAPGSPS